MLTPGIETNFAYGTCMLLFGLLVLSIRQRKTATPPMNLTYVPAARTAKRAAPRIKPTDGLRRGASVVPSSGLLMSTGLEYTPREESHTLPVPNFVDSPNAPLEMESLRSTDEVKMSPSPMPFESLDARLPAPKKDPSPSIDQYGPEMPAASEVAKAMERSAQEIAVALDFHVAEETASGIQAASEEKWTQNREVEASPVPVAPQAPVTSEKPAVTDVLTYFGMPQQPFDVTPDPSFIYPTASHREALESLKQGIEHFRGFMMLIAEPGMGKTTLLNKMMEELTDSARVVFLFQTQCTSRELLCFILNELEVDHSGMDVVSMHRALNQALLEEMLRGRRFVLVVDEAQNLQEPVLETIRLLSDFETTHSKLIQIVMAGQPQLAETLMKPSLVQLRQRVSVLTNLKALTPFETAAYIEHRLRASGWSDRVLFSSEALDQIAESSGGVPRRINNLCFNSLLLAFDRGLEYVEADIVREVADKLNLESLMRQPEAPAPTPESFVPAPTDTINAMDLARALAAALAAENRQETPSAALIGPEPKPGFYLTGNLTEKVRSQSWNKRHEYRLLVTLERDPISGLPVADHYYCCSIYVDEAQAAKLQPGKPVRIKIEQE